jgi:hypothetical protein
MGADMAQGSGSWLVIEELLERGEPAFVDDLRNFHDADRLAGFAAKWYADRRSSSRQLLFDYLNRPLNARHHEPLVKRLFKLAEAAGDDAVMARFLVLFDRAIRRVRRKRLSHSENRTCNTREAAQALLDQWVAEGAVTTNLFEFRGGFHVSALWHEERLGPPSRTTMPRGAKRRTYRNPRTGGRVESTKSQERMARQRLFSVHTRHYLRRRAWRYFRRLAKQHPDRYVPAVVEALKLYEDQDVADGLALLDNWALIHILFHYSPALIAKSNGWLPGPGHTLAELEPAPLHDELWRREPRYLLDLMKEARCRTVRRWVIHLIRRDATGTLALLSLDELLGLLAHDDEELVALASDALRKAPGVSDITVERWLQLLEAPNPAGLATLCGLAAPGDIVPR